MRSNLERDKGLIRTLIEQAGKLSIRDGSAFEKLRERARMILRNIPEVKEYASSLLNITARIPSWEFPFQDIRDQEWKLAVHRLTEPLELALEKLELFGSEKIEQGELSNKIFIVHGHDEAMKEGVARVIEKLDFEPIILHEMPDKGRTIIQKVTDYSDVGFVIALLSPDDESRETGGESDLKPRARQNVVFELGFFIGKLGQYRVLSIHRERKDFEFPSDYKGVLYTPYDSGGKWKYKIVEELRAAGYSVDANKLTTK